MNPEIVTGRPTLKMAYAARRWLARHTDPLLRRPSWLTSLGFRMQERQAEYLSARADLRDQVLESQALERQGGLAASVAEIRRQLHLELPDRSARRRAEHALVQYIEDKVQPLLVFTSDDSKRLEHVVEQGRACRMHGHPFVHPETAKRGVLWDCKCGKSRTCPDEAREEMMRVASHYAPQFEIAARRDPAVRAFYLVATFPHAASGELHARLRDLPARFRKLILNGTRPCTELDRERHGHSSRTRKILRFAPGVHESGKPYAGPGILGGLMVVEAPLSAALRWNVHLNVLLLVRGEFSYADIREAWSGEFPDLNIEIRQVDARDPYELAKAVREVIKYAAAHTGTKSEEKVATGQTKAPPMTEWPPELWLEWWRAHQGYRRVRSFGCMYRAPKPPKEDLGNDVKLVGEIVFADDGEYWVDLIPDDKFWRSWAAHRPTAPFDHGAAGRGTRSGAGAAGRPPGRAGPPSPRPAGAPCQTGPERRPSDRHAGHRLPAAPGPCVDRARTITATGFSAGLEGAAPPDPIRTPDEG